MYEGQRVVPIVRVGSGVYPTAHYLPPGYLPATPLPDGLAKHVTVSVSVGADGTARLTLRTAARASELEGGTVRGHRTIDNVFDKQKHRATITGTATRTCLTWSSTPSAAGRYHQVCGDNATDLTVDVLARVAESIG